MFWHLGHSVYYLIHHQIYGLVNQMSYNTFQVMFVLFPHVSIHSYIFWKSIKYHTWYFFQELWIILSSANIHSFFIRTMFSTPSLGVLWQILSLICSYFRGVYSAAIPTPNFFKIFENSLPQAILFFFAILKFGEGFQEGLGEFFQDLVRIYIPVLFCS